MPAPAGTGLSRRSFLLRTGGLALSVYGASMLRPAGVQGGDREGRPAATSGCSSRSSSTAAWTRSRCSPRSPTRATSSCGRRCGSSPARAAAWSEDPRLQWHPSAAPLQQLHGEGKVTVFPAIGYAGADQSHFTSRHYWEVGETRTRARTPAGSAACSTSSGSPDNPLQGLSLDGYLSPGLATGVNPVAAPGRPELRPLGAGRLG